MRAALSKNGPAMLLIILLVAVTSIATFWQLRDEAQQPPLASFSTAPDGGRALFYWAQALGYETVEETPSVFSLPENSRLALVLEPQLPGISEDEWQVLDEWVERGGTLLLAGEGFGAALSMQHFAFEIAYRQQLDGEAAFNSANLISPTTQTPRNLQPRAVLQSDRHDYATLLAINGEPLVAALSHGQGVVILSSLAYPFSNRGLKDAGNPQLVLNLLAQAGEARSIWFDEWHHGLRTEPAGVLAGPGTWLRSSPPGQAMLYTAAVVFLALVLSGKRFGRPISVKGTQQRRAPAEHAVAIANLSRRAGHRRAIRAYYRRELKQQLGRRYRLSAALPDEEYIRCLKLLRSDLDETRLRALLAALNQEKISENQLLKLAQEVTEWIR